MTKGKKYIAEKITSKLAKLSPKNVAKVALYFYGVDELAKGMIRDLTSQGSIKDILLAVDYIEKLK
jgi:hypothetical protein